MFKQAKRRYIVGCKHRFKTLVCSVEMPYIMCQKLCLHPVIVLEIKSHILNPVTHKKEKKKKPFVASDESWPQGAKYFHSYSKYPHSGFTYPHLPCILKPGCVLPAATRPACATHQHLSSPVCFNSFQLFIPSAKDKPTTLLCITNLWRCT